MKKISI